MFLWKGGAKKSRDWCFVGKMAFEIFFFLVDWFCFLFLFIIIISCC